MSNNNNNNPNDNPAVAGEESDASATDQDDRSQTSSSDTESYASVNDEKELRDRLIEAFTVDDDDDDSLDELRKLLLSISRQQQPQHHDQDDDDTSSSPVERAIHGALCTAAGKNKVEAIRLLFNSLSVKEQKKYSAETDKEIDKDAFPFFPLHGAAYYDHDEVVLCLVKDCNVDPNRMNAYGRTPLDCYMEGHHWYFENFIGSFESCRVLLEHGADPNLGDPMNSARGVRDLLSLFLEHGAKPTVSLIEHVVMDGLEDNLDLLLEHGAAVEEGFAWNLFEFLEKNPNDHDKKLNFCGFLVREHSKSSQSVTPAFMQSALDFAIRHGDVRCCDVFLATGKVPSRWALHYAVRDGNLPVCQMMAEYGADPFLEENNNNDENELATSLFHEAARQENTTILEFFLQRWDEHFSSTDGKNKNGDYPLHAACRDPKVSIQAIKALVEHQPASVLTMVDGEHGRGVLPFQLAGLCDASLDVIYYLLRRRPDALGRLPGNSTIPSTAESTMIITSRNTGSSHTVDVDAASSEDCEPRKKKAKTMLE